MTEKKVGRELQTEVSNVVPHVHQFGWPRVWIPKLFHTNQSMRLDKVYQMCTYKDCNARRDMMLKMDRWGDFALEKVTTR